MLTSLLLAVAIWGADPDQVFNGDAAPWAASEIAPPTEEHDEPASSSQRRPRRRALPCPFTARGQTVSDEMQAPFGAYCCDDFWESEFVKEFMRSMNPFVPEDVTTIPGYYDPFGIQMGTGSFGSLGYRLGWISHNDITVLPASAAQGTTGDMKIVEWNSYAKYSHLIGAGMVFSGTGWFNARWWDGPGGIDLPAQVDQISTDLELGFFNDGPWSGQIAFHPQIVETYEAKLDRNAFNFDGRVVVTYTASPQWSYVGGVAIWDRVDTMVIPTVGVIWTPNDRWELRLLFPRTRISYFLGNRWNADFWLYGTAEYGAEAWQAIVGDPGTSDRFQMTDERIALGLRWDSGRYTFFTEGGYVFDRQIKFAGSTPSFDLSDTTMWRVGFRY